MIYAGERKYLPPNGIMKFCWSVSEMCLQGMLNSLIGMLRRKKSEIF